MSDAYSDMFDGGRSLSGLRLGEAAGEKKGRLLGRIEGLLAAEASVGPLGADARRQLDELVARVHREYGLALRVVRKLVVTNDAGSEIDVIPLPEPRQLGPGETIAPVVELEVPEP